MALIKCPECGKQISDKAVTCPNCGYLVVLKETLESSKQSKSQRRMVSLATPIGILSILIVLYSVFTRSCWLIGIKMTVNLGSTITFIGDLLYFFTFALLFVWFLSLHKGSAEKSKMKTISVAALVGIICYLLTIIIDDWVYLTINAKGWEQVVVSNKWWIVNWRLCESSSFSYVDHKIVLLSYCLLNLLKFILFGSAFCALSNYFKGNLRTIAIMVGSLFILRSLILICFFPTGPNTILEWISWILGILSYIVTALFYFGFSKTN